ncbi:MAG: thioesterase family protein [Pseudomonadota bacterium]
MRANTVLALFDHPQTEQKPLDLLVGATTKKHLEAVQNTRKFSNHRNRTIEKRVFSYSFDVYLKDSNAYGNVYFARYFEWQGMCRERWFHRCIAEDMLQSQGELLTKSASQEYFHGTYPFQSVSCYLTTFGVRRCALSLQFDFFAAGELVSTGLQEVVFSKDKKIIPFPDALVCKVKTHSRD